MYNGFKDQDAFHAWMRERWEEIRREKIARQLDDPLAPAHVHAGCDHAHAYCEAKR